MTRTLRDRFPVFVASTAMIFTEVHNPSVHWLRALFFVLWLPLLAVRLSRIERRDTITGPTYVAFGLMTAAVLMWGLPLFAPIETIEHGMSGHAFWFGLVTLLLLWRYYALGNEQSGRFGLRSRIARRGGNFNLPTGHNSQSMRIANGEDE